MRREDSRDRDAKADRPSPPTGGDGHLSNFGCLPKSCAKLAEERCSTAGRVEAGMLAEERETEQVLRTCGGPCSSSASFAQLFGQLRAALRPASRSSSAYLQRGYRAAPPQLPLSTCSVSLSLFGQHRAALRPASRSSSAYLHVSGRILRTVDSMRADRPSPPTVVGG